MTSQRQRDRARRSDLFWSAKVTAARTLADRAAVEWDRLRSAVADLPADRAAPAWRQITDVLAEAREQVTRSHVDV